MSTQALTSLLFIGVVLLTVQWLLTPWRRKARLA